MKTLTYFLCVISASKELSKNLLNLCLFVTEEGWCQENIQFALYCPLLSLIFCPGAVQQCAALLGQQPAICEGEPPRQSPARCTNWHTVRQPVVTFPLRAKRKCSVATDCSISIVKLSQCNLNIYCKCILMIKYLKSMASTFRCGAFV